MASREMDDEMLAWIDSVEGEVPPEVHDLFVAYHDALGYSFDYMISREERNAAVEEAWSLCKRVMEVVG